MSIMIVPPSMFGATSGGSSGGGSSSSTEFANASTLKKLSTDENGNLTFNGKVIAEKSIEIGYNVTLEKNQSTIELPDDCDTSRAITVSLNGILLQEGEFWEVVEKSYPVKDFITLKGLDYQAKDKIFITYYRKV